jgi:hypothetical protein
VASLGLARRPRSLRGAVARLTAARAARVTRTFVPNPAQANVRATGRTLAGTSDAGLNSALELLCRLQA